MAKNEQKIKFEADVSGFKANIKEAQKSIKTLNNELKLNREQLKGDEKDTTALSDRIETLNKKYEEQTKVVENTRLSYEKAVEVFGENSTEAENLKNKLLQEETALQRVRNEINETNKKLDAQTNWLKNTGKEWEESGKRLQEYGKKIESVGNKLSILSGAVGGIAVASLKSSVDFESAFTGVTKTVDGTEEQLAQLREEILELSTQLPSSASEIASVAESAGQLGIATEDIMSFTKVMIDLGNSTNVSADEASTSLAKFANVTKMSAKDYEKLGSTIVDLGNNFATTEADIIAMGQNLASAGTQVGMSQSDIMALATALSSVGLEAQAGGTAFSKALVSMQLAVETNSKDLKNWADVAGMSTKEFSKLFKEDATSALQAFIKGLSECGGESESAIKVLDDMGITETRLRDSLLRSANASDTFSSAIKVGSKAWEENTALTNEANKRYSTTESQMKMLKNEVQKTAIEFGDELAPSLRQIVKDAKPMLNAISSAVKSFSKLDAQTKQSILRMGALVVAGGPAIKMGGKLITTLGSAKTAVGTFTGAIGVLKKGEEGASDGAIKMASSIKGIASPAGMTTLAIGALAVGYGVYSAQMDKVTKAEREETQAIKDSVNATKEKLQSYQDERDAIDKNMQSKVSEINYNKSLFSELKTIVDENGKIKDGYENRAKYITTQLSDALGIEIGINGDVIESYQKIQEEIDNTLLKQQAYEKYQASQEKASQARKNQDSVTVELNETRTQLEELRKEYEKMTSSNGLKALNSTTGAIQHIATLGKSDGKLKNLQKNIEELTNKEKSLNDELVRYSDLTTEATRDAELWTSGTKEDLEQLANATSNYVEINGEFVKKTSKQNIEALQTNIRIEKEKLEESIKNNDETNQRILQDKIDNYNKQLEEQGKALLEMTSVTERNSPDVIEAWRQLAQSESDIYQQILSQCGPEQQKAIESMVNATNEYSPELINSTSQMMAEVGLKMQMSSEFRKKALENMQGFLNGLNDQELRGLLENAGISDVETVMKGIREGNLAQSEGQKILMSLSKGLQDGTLTSKLFNVASGLANKLSGMLSIKANISSTAIPGHKSGLDYVPYDNYIARLHKGERVLTAEENREYLAGNIENKVASRNIVVQFYPQTMDESELKRAENYIARKWGMSL